jgi:hypothetical protein
MKVFLKPVLAALLGIGALIGAQTAHALPTCASAGGMSIAGPGQSATASSDCAEIAGGYNSAQPTWTADALTAFLEILAARWGGSASEWVFLGEIDGRTDSPAPDQKVLDYILTDRSIDSGTDAPSGAFSMTVLIDPDSDDPLIDNVQEFADKNLAKTLDIVGVLKPGQKDRSDPGGSGSFPESVLAYRHSSVAIGSEGSLLGTFDFGSAGDPNYFYPAGIGLFGRVLGATNPGGGGTGTGVPEPAGLALVIGAGAALAFSRRRRIA